MTREEVAAMLDSSGIQTAYLQFPESCGVQPPFICFYYGHNPFRADNRNSYVGITPLTVELYTDSKDFEKEETLERLFEDNGLIFDKDEDYIESENMYEIVYTMEVIINE